jgi:hypothetical protein
MPMPTTEKKPVTAANPGNDRLATIGDLEVDTDGLGKRSGEGWPPALRAWQ